MSEAGANENRKTFFLSILLAYTDFSLSYSSERLRSQRESSVLFLSFTSAFILFLANLPVQIAALPTFVNGNIMFYVGLLGFVAVFFMPLFLYLLSAILFVMLKAFNGRGSFYDLRLAVFWSINVAGPILIIDGLLRGFFFKTENIIYISYILEIFVGWIFANMVTEAEQFRSKYPMFLGFVFIISIPQLMTLI